MLYSTKTYLEGQGHLKVKFILYRRSSSFSVKVKVEEINFLYLLEMFL